MANKSLQHSSLTDNIFYRSMLAGNDAFFPEFESDDFLEEVVLTSSASSVTFSGLDAYSDYKHLQFRYVSQGSVTSATFVRFNSDTGSNYAYHGLRGTGSTADTEKGTSETSIRIYGAGPTPGGDVFTGGVVDILDFSSTSKNTTTRALYGAVLSAAASRIYLASGLWNNTAAVNSIDLISAAGGNFVAGSRFSLYGSKG